MGKTIAQEAYDLLKDIPEENWLTDIFTDRKGKCCLLGHYKRLKSDNPDDYSSKNCSDRDENCEGGPLRLITGKFLEEVHGEDPIMTSGAEVNNSPDINGYTQSTPKQRSMALLEDMIKHGY